MGKFRDVTGETFERLVAEKSYWCRDKGHRRWVCRCVCGKSHDVSADDLLKGKVRSCGCLRSDFARNQITSRVIFKNRILKHG